MQKESLRVARPSQHPPGVAAAAVSVGPERNASLAVPRHRPETAERAASEGTTVPAQLRRPAAAWSRAGPGASGRQTAALGRAARHSL